MKVGGAGGMVLVSNEIQIMRKKELHSSPKT